MASIPLGGEIGLADVAIGLVFASILGGDIVDEMAGVRATARLARAFLALKRKQGLARGTQEQGCRFVDRHDIRVVSSELAQFISNDRMPTVLFNGIGSGLELPLADKRIGESVLAMLASRLPAFVLAMTESPQQPAYRA